MKNLDDGVEIAVTNRNGEYTGNAQIGEVMDLTRVVAQNVEDEIMKVKKTNMEKEYSKLVFGQQGAS